MKVLVFDFDGTIADSFTTLVSIFEDITSRPKKLTPEEIKSLRGSSLKDIVKYLGVKRWQIPRLAMKAKHKMARRMPGVRPFKEMPAVIKGLHAGGYQMFILSTNSSSNIAKFLETSTMDSYFVKIYGDIGLRSKASALKKILRKQKIPAGQCIYIGDEVRDIEAAKKAGVSSIAVGWGFNYPLALKKAKPNAFAAQPHDLLTVISSL